MRTAMSKIASFAVKLLWSSYEAWSLVWAAATVTANGAASWGGAVALLIHFTEWPLWQQILISAGVALVGLTIFNWIIGLFKKPEPQPSNGTTVTVPGDENVIVTDTDVGGDIVGRDKKIEQHFYGSSPIGRHDGLLKKYSSLAEAAMVAQQKEYAAREVSDASTIHSDVLEERDDAQDALKKARTEFDAEAAAAGGEARTFALRARDSLNSDVWFTSGTDSGMEVVLQGADAAVTSFADGLSQLGGESDPTPGQATSATTHGDQSPVIQDSPHAQINITNPDHPDHGGDANQRSVVSVEEQFPQLYIFSEKLGALMDRVRKFDTSDEMGDEYSLIERGIDKVLSSVPKPRSYRNLFTNGRTMISDGSIARELSLSVGDPAWIYDAYRANSAIQVVIARLESETPEGLAHWLYRSGCPIFHLDPGTDFAEGKPQLLMNFTIDADSQPMAIEAAWIHGDTETTVTVMPEKRSDSPGHYKYQLKSFRPPPTEDVRSVSLEIQFRLDGRKHGARWTWPVQVHEKGHWIVENDRGSGVDQPNVEDTW